MPVIIADADAAVSFSSSGLPMSTGVSNSSVVGGSGRYGDSKKSGTYDGAVVPRGCGCRYAGTDDTDGERGCSCADEDGGDGRGTTASGSSRCSNVGEDVFSGRACGCIDVRGTRADVDAPAMYFLKL